MKPPEPVLNQLRHFRRLADITQQELADRIGVTRQTILSIEKSKYTPSVALALQLAEALSVRVEDLFQLNRGSPDDGSRNN